MFVSVFIVVIVDGLLLLFYCLGDFSLCVCVWGGGEGGFFSIFLFYVFVVVVVVVCFLSRSALLCPHKYGNIS